MYITDPSDEARAIVMGFECSTTGRREHACPLAVIWKHMFRGSSGRRGCPVCPQRPTLLCATTPVLLDPSPSAVWSLGAVPRIGRSGKCLRFPPQVRKAIEAQRAFVWPMQSVDVPRLGLAIPTPALGCLEGLLEDADFDGERDGVGPEGCLGEAELEPGCSKN